MRKILAGAAGLAILATCVLALGAAPQDKKPINAKCPVKGDDAKADVTTDYQGKTIGFC